MPTDTNRELDYEVALALGHVVNSGMIVPLSGYGRYTVPPYSTDPGTAVAAIQEFCETHGYFWSIRSVKEWRGDWSFIASITMKEKDPRIGENKTYKTVAKSACRCIVAAEKARKEKP